LLALRTSEQEEKGNLLTRHFLFDLIQEKPIPLEREGRFLPVGPNHLIHIENEEWSVFDVESKESLKLHTQKNQLPIMTYPISTNTYLITMSDRSNFLLNRNYYLFDLSKKSLQFISDEEVLSRKALNNEIIFAKFD
jgi:hypothetical protein